MPQIAAKRFQNIHILQSQPAIKQTVQLNCNFALLVFVVMCVATELYILGRILQHSVIYCNKLCDHIYSMPVPF